MSDEQIDIVTNQNQPTTQVAGRKEAHEKGLWHRTVHVYFYRAQESTVEILAHLRSKEKDSNPNKWDTRFGGHLKAGQSVLEGAVDEIREETGITVAQEDLAEAYWSISQENKHHSVNYFYHFKGKVGDLRFSDGEVQEVRWMSLEDIAAEMSEHPEKWTQGRAGFEKVAAWLRGRLNP